jgi:hypothetical protein
MRNSRQSRQSFMICIEVVALLMMTANAFAVVVSEGRRTVTLGDGTSVQLLLNVDRPQLTGKELDKVVNQQGGHKYYYLPPTGTVRLGRRPDGVPEFLLLKFTTEKREDQGGVNGAVMHFLMEYGLTPAQEEELRGKLRSTNDELLGAMQMLPDGEASTFLITSATLKDEGMTKSLVTSGKAPLLPGQKVAAAARLTGNGAQLLAATLESARSIADCSISFNLAYAVNTPAVNATAVFHSKKLQQERDRLRKSWDHTHRTTGTFLWWETSGEDSYTYREMRDQWQFLQDEKVVEFQYAEQGTPNDDRVTKIREAVFQSFLDSFFKADKPSPEQMVQNQKEPAKPDDGPGIQGDHFRSSIYRVKSMTAIEDRYWNFAASLPMKETMQLTGNLASWYSGVRDNPACVTTVNLNDPFFTHRDIVFILDLDAKEIFDEAVNFVTINVRKNRASGVPFADHKTIDAAYVKAKGVAATTTYSRAQDTNPEVYQYQAKWSLKGGNEFPANPTWKTGEWEGVTLSPPVRPLTIDLEGNLEELKEKGVTRVTAEIHFSQFGKEKTEKLDLSVAGGAAVVTKKFFRDRDVDDYAYRLIFNHKTAGKLVGEWQKNQTDGYIYAVLPEDALTEQAFKDRARGLATGAVEKILSKLGGKLDS